jgi:hypothetical protein
MSDSGVNEWLKRINDEFDLRCQRTNTDYSIECDEPNIQSYRITKTSDLVGFLHHIVQSAKDYPVDIEVNDQPVKSGDINSSEFNIPPRKGGTILKFMVRPIQETDMDSVQEDQLKFPGNRHGRIQGAFPSSFRKHKTRDTYEGSKGKKKKKKAKSESFEQKLDTIINETVGVALTKPDILFTKNDMSPAVPNVRSTLEETKQAFERALQNLAGILEQSSEDEQIVLEDLIEGCTSQLAQIKSLIDHGTPQADNLS